MSIKKTMKKTYYVRHWPLHKEIFDLRGRRTKQTYQPNDPVELTDAEFLKYKHLVETAEQVEALKKGK